jgi:transcription elongation factor GreA
VEGRIRALERQLSHVEIIQPGDLVSEVRLGSQVTILERGRLVKTYTIVGSVEADARSGLISDESPMGRALLGQHVGEIVEVAAPDGMYEIRIIGIT